MKTKYRINLHNLLSSRPNIQVSSDDPGDKARQHRYRLLIFPVMRLINTLQTTLADRITALQVILNVFSWNYISSENFVIILKVKSIIQKVMHFAISHLDALLAPLNSNCMEPSKG